MNDQETQAFEDGQEAFDLGLDEDQNPFLKGTSLADFWEQGWEAAFDETGE